MKNYIHRGVFWTAVYLVMVMAPLIVLFIDPVPGGSGFWWDLSLVFGFAGAAMIGTMFFLTARFQNAAAPFGIDLIYYFHHWVSLVAFVFIVAHPVILLIVEPGLLEDLKPSAISGHMQAGFLSLLALCVLIAVSMWRKQLKIEYDSWRLWHALLAIAALLLAFFHIAGVAHYVASPWKKMLWGGITACWLALLVYIRLIKPVMALRHTYIVREVIQERGKAWSLVVEPDGHPGFGFMPGQFAWLTLWHSPFALKEHPFSISSSARHRGSIRFTVKELGDFTSRIGTVVPGQVAYLDGPHGAFSIDRHPNADYVFIAGGIGIAPIMGMLRTLVDRGDSRPLTLFYAYNDWEGLTFREELEVVREKLNLELIFVLADPPADWQGEKGFITEELLTRRLPEFPGRYHYYLCGPVVMTSKVEKSLKKFGVALHRIHTELFDLA